MIEKPRGDRRRRARGLPAHLPTNCSLVGSCEVDHGRAATTSRARSMCPSESQFVADQDQVVRRDEIDAALHQPGNEMDVSGEAVELRDNQRGFRLLCGGNRSRELRPIGTFPALDFAEIRDQFAAVSGHMPPYCLALGIQAETAPTLAIGRDLKYAINRLDMPSSRHKQTTVCMIQKHDSMSTV
jgi:hypothetical protein